MNFYRISCAIASAAVALCLGTSGSARAHWPPNGTTLCRDSGDQDFPHIASDGKGGAIVAWRDYRKGVDSSDVYAQHVTTEGNVAPGWPMDGLPVCAAESYQNLDDIVADGVGGFYVAWQDFRNDPIINQADIYVIRVSSQGALPPGWAVNGNSTSTARGYQDRARLASDDNGGVFVVWQDFSQGSAQVGIYAQRVTSQGTVVPG